MESYDKVRLRAMYYSLDSIMYRSTLLYGILRQSTAEGDSIIYTTRVEVLCSMESYDKVRQMAMYYSLDSIMYRSTLLYGIVRQSTAGGDVLFARQDHV